MVGYVIKFDMCSEWYGTYFVKTDDENEAKKKAYEAFKQDSSCYLPDTLDEAENCGNPDQDLIVEIEEVDSIL